MTSPSPNLGLDETLYPYRGSTGMKQYNPNKRASLFAAYMMLLCLIRTIGSNMQENY